MTPKPAPVPGSKTQRHPLDLRAIRATKKCPYEIFKVCKSKPQVVKQGYSIHGNYSPSKHDIPLVQFLSAIAHGATYKEAFEVTGLDWPLVRLVRSCRPDFKEAHTKSLEDREFIWQARREDVSEERAIVGGTTVTRDRDGNITSTTTRPSDKLLEMKLVAGDRAKYDTKSSTPGVVNNILNVNNSEAVGHTLAEIFQTNRQEVLIPPGVAASLESGKDEEVLDAEVLEEES